LEDNVHWLFEAQKSSEFDSLLNLVAESEINGEPKFTIATCHELGRLLVCRAYAPAILELCYLATIANSCGSPSAKNSVENFFWDSGLARPGNFRAYILESIKQSGWHNTGFAATDNGVDITCGDINFSISFSRMPLLSALMDFLTSAIDYLELDETIQEIFNPQPSKQKISDCANKLSKKLYGFLKQHLPTAQEQRKFHRLIDFLRNSHPMGFDHLSINDPLLLEFWLQESGHGAADNLDFKTFPTVFRLFVHLRNTLEQISSLRGIENARNIGSDYESGEIDPDEILRIVETIDTPTNALHELQSPPAKEIKFLNNKEQARLERIAASGPTANPLALSLLRCEAFEPLRKRLTQALRDKATSKRIDEIINTDSADSYLKCIEELSKDREHLDRALLASAHVLISSQHNDAIPLTLEIKPDLNLSFLSNDKDDITIQSLGNRFFQLTNYQSSQDNHLTTLAKDAHYAFKKIARKGFKEEDIVQAPIIDGFASGSSALNKLKKQLDVFLGTLNNYPTPSGDWQQQYLTDKEIFSKQFHILYCGADSTTKLN
jgi:hypothetical protein